MDFGAIGQIPNVAHNLTPYPGNLNLGAQTEEARKAQEEYQQNVVKTHRRLLAATFASNLPIGTAEDFVSAVRKIEAFLQE